MPKKKERTSERLVKEEVSFIGQGQAGMQPVKLVTELKRYTFRNLGNSMYYCTPKNSRDTKALHPGETRDDFTSKDREVILGSQFYRIGQVVEVFEEDEMEEKAFADNPNSLNDKQLKKLLLMDNSDIKEHILKMDSPFALSRLKEGIVKQGLPAHLVSYIDSRTKELMTKYEQDNIAPVGS